MGGDKAAPPQTELPTLESSRGEEFAPTEVRDNHVRQLTPVAGCQVGPITSFLGSRSSAISIPGGLSACTAEKNKRLLSDSTVRAGLRGVHDGARTPAVINQNVAGGTGCGHSAHGICRRVCVCANRSRQ